MEKLKNFASGLRSKFKKSDIEKLLEIAISSNDLPPRSIYTDLAEKLQSAENLKIILKVINENLTPTNKEIHKIIKSLLLCEALCSIGSSSFMAEFKSSVNKVKTLSDYYTREKTLDRTGLIIETATSLLKLLNEETGSVPVQSAPKEVVEINPSSWYESAKVDISHSGHNNEIHVIDKSLFVRDLPETKKDLFAGLKFKNEKLKLEEKKENLPNNEKTSNSLFGVPMKERFVKKEDIVKKVENEGNGNGDMFSLLSLDFKEGQNIGKKEEVKKKENSNTGLNAQKDLGCLSSGFNNLEFDKEFPVMVGKDEERDRKFDFTTLEDTLINLDGLDSSLSKSKVSTRGRISQNNRVYFN